MFEARVVLDSINPTGQRLTTVLATYPRFIHSEVLTHRAFARNSASSRAIPYAKMRENIMMNPVLPLLWGAEQRGMQTGQGIGLAESKEADAVWLRARNTAIEAADKLAALGIHKSLCNRVVEPFMWMTTLISGTEWNNFFRLRVHPDAEIHFQHIANKIKMVIGKSSPTHLEKGEWHTPFIETEDQEAIIALAKKYDPFSVVWAGKRVSAGRCARLSFLTHDKKRDVSADLELCEKLINRRDDVLHASPLEHVAEVASPSDWSGPFHGWKQFRKEFANENVPGGLS